MKGLKKLVLVTAIAATPLVANAQLKALNDSTLGSVTGQAGVTVEVQTQIGIGSIVYTDTDTNGQFEVKNVAIGGAGTAFAGVTSNADGSLNYSAATSQAITTNALGGTVSACTSGSYCSLNDLAFNIDVDAAGTAVIGLTNYDLKPVDFGVAVGQMDTHGTAGTTVLLSNLRMAGSLSALGITVGKTSDAFTAMTNYYNGISSAVAQAAPGTSAAAAAAGAAQGAAALDGELAALATGTNGDSNNGDVLAFSAVFSVDHMQFDAPLMATQIRNMTITGAGGGQALVAMSVYSGGSLMGYSGAGDANTGGVLRVDVATSPMDIKMGNVLIGGKDIGSVAINGLTLTNTRLAVYGH